MPDDPKVYVDGEEVAPCVKKKGDVEFRQSVTQQVENAPKIKEATGQ